MRKLFRFGIVLVIIIGTQSGVASAKTLFVVDEARIQNATETPADALAVDVKLTTYNNQCMVLTFSSAAAVMGTAPLFMAIRPEIDGTPALPTLSGDGVVYYNASNDNSYDIISFTWYRCGLNIGRHTVAIRYNPVFADRTAILEARFLKIDIKSGKIVPPLPGAELEGTSVKEDPEMTPEVEEE